jgi:hypothetical protein
MIKISIKRSLPIAFIIILICLPFICAILSARNAVIKQTSGGFYRAKSLIVLGDFVFGIKDPSVFQTRPDPEAISSAYRPFIDTLKNIEIIEFFYDIKINEKNVNVNPVGIFLINASGHKGYLYITSNNGYAYGSVRFPQWAKGVYEPLKGLKVSKNEISFTRSVTNPAEQKAVGAPSYFIQQYSGKYYNGGLVIKGFYVKDGARFSWEAVKISK